MLSVPTFSVLLCLCLRSACQEHWLRLLRLLDFDRNPISCYLFNQYACITSYNDFGKWQRELPHATHSSEKCYEFLLFWSWLSHCQATLSRCRQPLKPPQTWNNYLSYKGCWLLLLYIQCRYIQSLVSVYSHCTAALWLYQFTWVLVYHEWWYPKGLSEPERVPQLTSHPYCYPSPRSSQLESSGELPLCYICLVNGSRMENQTERQ